MRDEMLRPQVHRSPCSDRVSVQFGFCSTHADQQTSVSLCISASELRRLAGAVDAANGVPNWQPTIQRGQAEMLATQISQRQDAAGLVTQWCEITDVHPALR